MLVRHEPLASIVAEAFDAFTAGRLEGIAEAKRFLEGHPAYPRDRHGEVRFQRVKDLLTQPIYAGYMDVAKWGISLHPGRHEPLISFETCGKPMTAAWSKGRSRKYPYYLCDTKACPDYRKSIRKERIEREFEELLTEMVPEREPFLAVGLPPEKWSSLK